LSVFKEQMYLSCTGGGIVIDSETLLRWPENGYRSWSLNV
jgi:hypothetical protein